MTLGSVNQVTTQGFAAAPPAQTSKKLHVLEENAYKLTMPDTTHPSDPAVQSKSVKPASQVRRRKSARPEEILSAAMAEFAEHGFAATRITDIARRAGVAKGTVYLYFETKQAIFHAASETTLCGTMEQIDGLIEDFAGPTDMLLQMIITKVYSNIVQSDARVTLRIIIGEGHLFPELRKYHYDTAIRRSVALLDKVVQRGIDRGEFRNCLAREYPRVIMAPAMMAAIWSMCFEEFEPTDLDRYMTAHIDLIMNGLRNA